MMIRKKILFVLLFIVCFFSFCKVSYAETCAQISEETKNYRNITKKLESLDCTQVNDENIVNSCNDLHLKQNQSAIRIYHMKEFTDECPKIKKEVTSILKENQERCGEVFGDYLDKAVKYVMGIFYVIGPILLLFFGTIDFSMATVASDRDALKKATNKFMKRLLATIILFLSPVIVNIIISFNNTGTSINSDAYVCDYEHINFKKTYKIIIENPDDGGGGGTTVDPGTGEYLQWKQFSGPWKDAKLCGVAGCSLSSIGCITTSIAIQIAKTGLAGSNFDPAVLVSAIRSGDGYSSTGGIKWSKSSAAWQTIAPGFVYEKETTITGDGSSKETQLGELMSQGYYPVVEVKAPTTNGSDQHWVAAVGYQNGHVIFADPGSSSNDVLNNSKYNFTSTVSKRVELYKINN